jgi:hypothetical protein
MPLFPIFHGFLCRKKYPTFLTADDNQIFSALEILSQKIRTRIRTRIVGAMGGECVWRLPNLISKPHGSVAVNEKLSARGSQRKT